MFIHFDKNKIHMQVICGSLEEYKPTEDVKELHNKIASLHKKVEEYKIKLDKFMADVVKPEVEEIEKRVEEINSKNIITEDETKT